MHSSLNAYRTGISDHAAHPVDRRVFGDGGSSYQFPSINLYAILAAEGGRVGQAVEDKNGTSDLGPFQINTRWRVSTAEALALVRDDGCANAIAAAAILKRAVNEAHGDLPAALGLYHSHSPELAESYRNRILLFAANLRERRK
jgi:hypothetical protein